MLQKHEFIENDFKQETIFLLYTEFSTVNVHKVYGINDYVEHLT